MPRFEANCQPWKPLSCSLPWSETTLVLEAPKTAREDQVGLQACQQAAAERTTGLSLQTAHQRTEDKTSFDFVALWQHPRDATRDSLVAY